jgi:hypothetical protein
MQHSPRARALSGSLNFSLSLLFTLSPSLTANAAAILGQLVVDNRGPQGTGGHQANQAVVPIHVYFVEGDLLIVESACAGCLLDVSLKAYVGAEAESAVPFDVPMSVHSGPTDTSELALAAFGKEPFGIIVHTTVIDETSGKAVDEVLTFFGVVNEGGGELTLLTWTEFVCARGFANCYHEETGQFVVDLGLAIETDDDAKEAFIVGGE